MESTTDDYFSAGDGDGDESFKDYLKAMAIVDRPDFGVRSQHHHGSSGSPASIKKCSRCRMKRIHESEMDLHKYQTCAQCRAKRKVKERRPRQLTKLPNVCDNWAKFLNKVSLNQQMDLHQHNFRAFTEEEMFPRYRAEDLTPSIIHETGEKIIQTYMIPLQNVTGFKFAIRDHHNPQLTDLNKAKKITWMYICSQDRTRRRKSRSENKRQIVNKLKTEDCESKINLSYDIVNGVIQMCYNHKHHKPANGISIKSISNSVSGPSSSSTSAASGTTTSSNGIPMAEDMYTNLPYDKSIHQQFQELQKQHQLLQTEEEEEQRFFDSKDVVNVANTAVRSRGNTSVGDGSSDVEVDSPSNNSQSVSMAKTQSPSQQDHLDHLHHHHHHHRTDSFDPINIGIDDDNYDDNGNGANVDVDVAEIAKLLKQVQQSTSNNSTIKINNGNNNDQLNNLGLEEIASLVGLGPDDLTLLNDSSYSVNQNILEQVREQVRKGQASRDEDDEEMEDNENDDSVVVNGL